MLTMEQAGVLEIEKGVIFPPNPPFIIVYF